MKPEPTSKAKALLRSLQVFLIPDLRPALTTLARRTVLPLLLFGAGLLLISPCGATPFRWELTGSLHAAREYHSATLLPNGKVLLAGGTGPIPPYDLLSAELYDPHTETWSFTGSLNAARYEHTATLLRDGRVLVVGGAVAANQFLASAELYDQATGTWTMTGSLNSGLVLHTATLLPNGRVLVAGGIDSSGTYLSSAELYDPVSGTWRATGRLNTARAVHTATLLPDGRVLVAGGASDSPPYYLRSAELYDPVTETWTVTASLNTGRDWHTAISLSDGKVLVAAGNNDSGFLASAELYDPASATWTITGSLNEGREQTPAALLSDGRVLVAGGYKPFAPYQFTASAELYDPVTGNWTFTDRLHTARASHTGTLLADGKMLVAGGTDGPTYLASAELYDPGIGAATKVVGNGSIDSQGNEVTFNFSTTEPNERSILGFFSFCDPTGGICRRRGKIRNLSITGTTVNFSGGGYLDDGTKVTFDVSATDNESIGIADTISISLSNGYSVSGNLTDGDIRIVPKNGMP